MPEAFAILTRGDSIDLMLTDLIMPGDKTGVDLAREAVAWDETERALAPDNLLRARRLSEAWAENAGVCHHDDQLRVTEAWLLPEDAVAVERVKEGPKGPGARTRKRHSERYSARNLGTKSSALLRPRPLAEYRSG